MWFIYDLIIRLYGATIHVAGLFSPKARLWVIGRRNNFELIRSAVGSQQSAVGSQQSAVGSQQSAVKSHIATDINEQQTADCRPPTADRRPQAVIWFHCASLGEFEQGRPVIEAFRRQHPGWKIVLTFFSPSGYEVRKNYDGADHIFYLPLDTPGNAKKFIELINPSLAVFVKYEYWFRYLDVLHRKNIPVYFISAIFRENHHFFKWYGGWALKQLKKVTRFFVQDEASADLLRAKGIGQVVVSGDTRFDRVASIAEKAKSFPLVERFAADTPVFLAGSTWPADEELIFKLIEQYGDKMKFIIAPHEVHRARIEALGNKIPNSKFQIPAHQKTTVLFSGLSEESAAGARVLIVDGIGYLMHLYQYATVAYIGGGFGAGIHNILEAATFGKPVIFGPKYGKFREAVELIEAGGAFSIRDAKQLAKKTIRLVTFPELLKKTSATCAAYVQHKKGATDIILSGINSRI